MFLICSRSTMAVLALGLSLALGSGAVAQEISQSHLQAAQRASRAAPGVGDFDSLLPFLSEQVQNRLIRTRPDLFSEIADAVEAQALELAARRAELDNEIGRTWARRFSEAELEQIAAFFGSELGARYKEVLPGIGEEMIQSSRRWSGRIGEELYELSLEAMKRQGHEF